eukprot:TRINITY_DN222_c0_g1_i5.p1 TRINITY_DN222_c0_g1~~TRINITY_DN222_c0_g1_i5.p1  ORF type:complete len:141 (+),score=11.26 TRINITY_DN222_c0_g1_i5:699-1121(+)
MFFISSSLHLLSSYSHANKCSQHHCAIFSQLFCSLLLTNQATRPHFYLLETFPNNLRINFIMDLNKSINQRQKSYLDPSLFPVLLWLRDVQLLIASVFYQRWGPTAVGGDLTVTRDRLPVAGGGGFCRCGPFFLLGIVKD